MILGLVSAVIYLIMISPSFLIPAEISLLSTIFSQFLILMYFGLVAISTAFGLIAIFTNRGADFGILGIVLNVVIILYWFCLAILSG